MNLRLVTFLLLTAIGTLVPATNFAADRVVTVQVRVDSESPGYEGFRAMDGNPQTMWHTDFQFQGNPAPA